jgi:hypothetical protein
MLKTTYISKQMLSANFKQRTLVASNASRLPRHKVPPRQSPHRHLAQGQHSSLLSIWYCMADCIDMSQAHSRIRLYAKNLGVLQNSVTLNNTFQLFKMTCRFQSTK